MVIGAGARACWARCGTGTGSSRLRISVNAVGQSSSVPSSNPIRYLVVKAGSLLSRTVLAESGHVVGELGTPGRPVVGHVVAPHVQFVLDPFLVQQRGDPPGPVQRPGGVLPLALTADQQQADLPPQPLQVAAPPAADVFQRVFE